MSEYFSLRSRYWTQIRPDGLIFDPYQGKLKSFRKFENFTKSRNKALVSPMLALKSIKSISAFSCLEKFCILLLENVNHVIKGHAQHEKDQLFYNRTDYNRKIFVKDNLNAKGNK